MRTKRRNKKKVDTKKYWINKQIRASEVNVIDDNNERVGILPLDQALALAESKSLDLVEVSPLAKPPVCKILDYGKFLYQQNRSQQKSKSKKTEIKGIRISLKIGLHDIQFKQKQAIKFLEQGHKVKVELRLKGRERSFKKQAREKVKEFLNTLDLDFKEDKKIEVQGNTITTIITK